jgi:hypothetical protein
LKGMTPSKLQILNFKLIYTEGSFLSLTWTGRRARTSVNGRENGFILKKEV